MSLTENTVLVIFYIWRNDDGTKEKNNSSHLLKGLGSWHLITAVVVLPYIWKKGSYVQKYAKKNKIAFSRISRNLTINGGKKECIIKIFGNVLWHWQSALQCWLLRR